MKDKKRIWEQMIKKQLFLLLFTFWLRVLSHIKQHCLKKASINMVSSYE